MSFKFICHAPLAQRPRVARADRRDSLRILAAKHDSRSNARTIRHSPSVDFSESHYSPKSPTGSALSLDSESPTHRSSHDDHCSLADSLPPSLAPDGRPPTKVSAAWKKTLHDYFKSDDESDILSSDDEFWLSRSKRLTDQEPPSGKTRPSKQKTCHSSAPPRRQPRKLGPSRSVDLDSDFKNQSVESHDGPSPMAFPVKSIPSESPSPDPPCPSFKLSPQEASPAEMVPSITSHPPQAGPDAATQDQVVSCQPSPIVTPRDLLQFDSEFPPLRPPTREISHPATACLDAIPPVTPQLGPASPDPKIQEFVGPDQPPSSATSCHLLPVDSEFPPSSSSPKRERILSHSAPRLVCSFSATCQPSNDGGIPAPTAGMHEKKLMSKLLAESHEKSLRESLPLFRIFSPGLIPHTISICPSDQRPVSELPELIDSICSDGIPLPSGKTSLEGGPYLAVAFDMTCSVSHTPGRENRTALLQLASRSRTLIIQISRISSWRLDGLLPSCLIELLVNPQIVKVGVGIRNDGLKLLRDHKLGPKPYLNSFLELGRLVRSLGDVKCSTGFTRLVSLQQMVADHLKVYLPKFDTWNSDWTQPLSSDQVKHAASNIIATIRVTKQLFDSFEKATKSRPKLLILDFIESLEPDVDRVLSSRPPAVPSPRKPWVPAPTTAKAEADRHKLNPNLGHATKSGDGVNSTKKPFAKFGHPNQSYQHLGQLIRFKEGRREGYLRYMPLKARLSAHIQQAWELWYHKGLSVGLCSKAMKAHPFKFGILIGKMLLHLKLNEMTLDDYYYQKVKRLGFKPNTRAIGSGQDPAADGQENREKDGLEEAEKAKQDNLEKGAQDDDPVPGEHGQMLPRGEQSRDESTLAEEAASATVQSKANPDERTIETMENESSTNREWECVEETTSTGIELANSAVDHNLKVGLHQGDIELRLTVVKPPQEEKPPSVFSTSPEVHPVEASIGVANGVDAGCHSGLSHQVTIKEDHRCCDPHTDPPSKPKLKRFDWWEDVEQTIENVPVVDVPISEERWHPTNELGEPGRSIVGEERELKPVDFQPKVDEPTPVHLRQQIKMDLSEKQDMQGSKVNLEAQALDIDKEQNVEVSQELHLTKQVSGLGSKVRVEEPESQKPVTKINWMTTSGVLATTQAQDHVESSEISTTSGLEKSILTTGCQTDGCESAAAREMDRDGEVEEENRWKPMQTKNFKLDVNDHELHESAEKISELNRRKLSLLVELVIGLNVDRNLHLCLSDFGL